MSKKNRVAFVCVYNSCRSQMAETISKIHAADVYEAYSAGTETKPQINQDAVYVIKELYDVDMNKSQKSKLLSEIPPVDVVITMGCNVNCPYLPSKSGRIGGWKIQLEKIKVNLFKTAKIIEKKVLELKDRISNNKLFNSSEKNKG